MNWYIPSRLRRERIHTHFRDYFEVIYEDSEVTLLSLPPELYNVPSLYSLYNVKVPGEVLRLLYLKIQIEYPN